MISNGTTKRISLISTATGLALLCGCSEMRFVNTPDTERPNDARENIVLKDVEADLTSAGLVQRRVRGTEAIYSENLNQLLIREVTVEALNGQTSPTGITKADMGLLHLADAAPLNRGKGDMEFAGNVHYRAMSKTDPVTETLSMHTEHVLWSDSAGEFVSKEKVNLLMHPPDGAPIRQTGKSFKAPKDLSSFKLIGGKVTTKLEENTASTHEELKKQFQLISSEIEAQKRADSLMDLPTTIAIPSESGKGLPASKIEVPIVQSSGYVPPSRLPEIPVLRDGPVRAQDRER